ncbi:MAG: hypothetical protein E6G84_16195 [Alphaproteobacteria bacterium]|nr:MAG: hypothetical protein E6G84_16195 [Alphaproteobacteria bacterium]
MKKNLWKAALAGVIALAAVGPASATKFRPTHVGSVLTDGQIHRMKATLRLTRMQEQYWPPIEAALREMARELSRKSASEESSAAAIDQAKVQRLASVAYPLLATLDESQKRNAMALARAMGLGSLVASF